MFAHERRDYEGLAARYHATMVVSLSLFWWNQFIEILLQETTLRGGGCITVKAFLISGLLNISSKLEDQREREK